MTPSAQVPGPARYLTSEPVTINVMDYGNSTGRDDHVPGRKRADSVSGARTAPVHEAARDEAAMQAKAVLQAEYGMTEPEAYRWLRETAMNERRTLQKICEAVIAWTMLPGSGPFPSTSRYEDAARTLRAEIVGGTRVPGSSIGVAEVHAAHGISKKSVRRLLRALAGEGLVHVRPNGYYVRHEPPLCIPRDNESGGSGEAAV